MQSRPDRPLIVKCTFDRWNKRITFASSRNCTYILLRHKVEQCFSLSASTYAITYKDDDGEITDIRNETDLTEAIQYFQAGNDDPPLSSAASILSGRSFGSRKITLRVHITVDYDGPSLSDTSSVISLDEYRGRNGSEFSFSLGAPSVELDDDSVTVSSKDTGAMSRAESSRSAGLRPPDRASQLSGESSFSMVSRGTNGRSRSPGLQTARGGGDPFLDDYRQSVESRFPEDPSAVINHDSLAHNRGAEWLRDQNERTIRATLGMLPEPSEVDTCSLVEQDASQTHDDITYDIDPSIDTASKMEKPRTYVIPEEKPSRSHSNPSTIDAIPRELLESLPLSSPEVLTSCSECGVLLDSIRYVCSMCGEKDPIAVSGQTNGKGKDRDPFDDELLSYPPQAHRHLQPPSQNLSSSSLTYVGSYESLANPHHRYKPLPSVPNLGSTSQSPSKGYELCSGCIESAGLMHAIEAGGVASGSSPTASNKASSSPEGASEWRRLAPKEKGKLRHAYHEKIWSYEGWKDVEQDAADTITCSACGTVTPVGLGKCFKCASCKKHYLCRGCYSQVHERHPQHAFYVVPDKDPRSLGEPDYFPNAPSDPSDEEFMKHPGVKCAAVNIVGARFHCAICDSIDICSNCESAGLPGNLDSADGGHNSSHILIKIPFPLETNEVQTASRRAIHLWTGRDAQHAIHAGSPSKASSVVSGYSRTVVGTSHANESEHDHLCNGCARPIVGVRYQCANCPSKPRSYNLCARCEERSYRLHDPHHVFFKLPRPVDYPIESQFPLIPKLYKVPAGPPPDATVLFVDPKAYLRDVYNSAAVCDNCMSRIRGVWFRCAYCGKDLCDACEPVDVHNDKHVFLVFKSLVDMQAVKIFTDIEHPTRSPPIIPHPVYR
ncbi:uncharacterized protein EV420DRAFT_1626509 [Desarmillaria tabescens]|uniref:ZZ-type domain-containing protein n=1 Tax=Armillaria tabescens TaxID=1929756 RepID=A0AA39TQP1_ARMTA|nr:uncharacterized protein EV420DRAFT_1626509 [Desarmillaria tabescens]KAK0467157.1 hypothetical protein EV420DRAFT_1626509 [Desarmillaria tabescens]